MNGWSSLVVHHAPSKARARSAPVFIYPPMVYHLGVVWPVWMWSPCLVACAMVYQPHVSTHWWIDRGVKIYTYGWSSWYITHHQMQRLKMCQFSFLHVHPSFGCCVASMDVIPLLGCLYNGVSTSPMHSLMDWQGYQHMHGWLEFMVHHIPSKVEDESAPVFIHLPMEHSLGCMTSMDVIPLFVCLCNGVSTSPMHPLMDWEWCQYLYWLLELMVHHTPSKADDESTTVFIYPPMVYHLGVVWPVWIWFPCLVAYTTW